MVVSTGLVGRTVSSRALRWFGGKRWHDAIGTGLAFGVLGMVLLMAVVRLHGATTVAGPIGDGGWTSRSRAWLSATRLYPPELQDNGGAFSWTGGTARLSIPHLSRSRPQTLHLIVSGPRAAEHGPTPQLTVWIDGNATAQLQTDNHRKSVSVVIPAAPTEGVVVRLEVSSTFVPGLHDPRMLGVIVHEVGLSSSRSLRPTVRALAWGGLAIAMAVTGVWWCGVGRRVGLMVSAGITVAFVYLLLRDAAFLGPFVERLARAASGIAIAGGAMGLVRLLWPSTAGLPELPTVVGITLGAAAAKLGLLVHPLMTVGDGVFQVHRAQYVQSGHYFFTSVTPRPFFEFPYAIGLYVVSLPLWSYFPTTLDRLVLLRVVVLGADALVGVALYAAARRQWGASVPALLCAAIWPFAQAPMHALGNANLANAFAQALFSLGMAGIIWLAARPRKGPIAIAATVLALTGAFLSHFSTLAVGLPLLGLVAVSLLAGGQGHVRRAGVWVVALTITAAALSYVVYYSHFTDTYRETVERVRMHERTEDEPAGASIAAAPGTKLRRWVRDGSDDYGRPTGTLFAASVAGAVLLVRHRRREALTLVLAGWGAAWIAWTALGIMTPVQMRAALAGAPLFVWLAAYALGRWASHSDVGKVLAAAVGVVVAWEGIRVWLLHVGTGGG